RGAGTGVAPPEAADAVHRPGLRRVVATADHAHGHDAHHDARGHGAPTHGAPRHGPRARHAGPKRVGAPCPPGPYSPLALTHLSPPSFVSSLALPSGAPDARAPPAAARGRHRPIAGTARSSLSSARPRSTRPSALVADLPEPGDPGTEQL